MTDFDLLCKIKKGDYDQYHFDDKHKDSKTGQFFDEESLLKHLHLDKVTVSGVWKKSSGGFNDVYECKDSKDPSKLYTFLVSKVRKFTTRVRYDTVSNFSLRDDDIVFNYDEIINQAYNGNKRFYRSREDFISSQDEYLVNIVTQKQNEEKVTIKNWNIASKLKISPKVIFNGYVMKVHGLHHVIVSEKYDYDLQEFCSITSSNPISKVDDDIAKQLIKLFEKMHTEMNVICFDVKPQNAVIKVLDGGVDVRLIDWDGDWCHENTTLLHDKKFKKIVKLMSILFMANNFINYEPSKNIFINYFVNSEGKPRKKIQDLRDIIGKVFCDDNFQYEYFARHYILRDKNLNSFKDKMKTYFNDKYKTNTEVLLDYNNSKNSLATMHKYIDKPTQCGFIFDIAYENVITRTHPNADDIKNSESRKSSSKKSSRSAKSKSSTRRNRPQSV